MTAKSNYLEQAVLNVLRGTDITAPVGVFCSLHGPGSGTDAPGTEFTGGSYARQAVTFSAPVAETGQPSVDTTGYQIANTAPVAYTNLPAGTIATIAIWDAVTDGNLLYWGSLTGGSRVVSAGDSFTIATGDLKVVER